MNPRFAGIAKSAGLCWMTPNRGHLRSRSICWKPFTTRWVALLRSLGPDHFERHFLHPYRGPLSLGLNLAFYAWHGRHHIAHITSLRD